MNKSVSLQLASKITLMEMQQCSEYKGDKWNFVSMEKKNYIEFACMSEKTHKVSPEPSQHIQVDDELLFRSCGSYNRCVFEFKA